MGKRAMHSLRRHLLLDRARTSRFRFIMLAARQGTATVADKHDSNIIGSGVIFRGTTASATRRDSFARWPMLA